MSAVFKEKAMGYSAVNGRSASAPVEWDKDRTEIELNHEFSARFCAACGTFSAFPASGMVFSLLGIQADERIYLCGNHEKLVHNPNFWKRLILDWHKYCRIRKD